MSLIASLRLHRTAVFLTTRVVPQGFLPCLRALKLAPATVGHPSKRPTDYVLWYDQKTRGQRIRK